jgi:hypothetical protein
MKFLTKIRLFGLALLVPISAYAQWQEQTIQLRPGWNAVFLEVSPEPALCDSVFAGTPVESVWDFNRVVDLPQFVQDPTSLMLGAPGWLTWFPPQHPLSGQANLFALRDGRPYLVKVATNASPFTLKVTGRPSLRRSAWVSGGMNFVGFHVSTNAPSFRSLFMGEAGLSDQPIYTLDAAGVWRKVADPATARPRPGESYWIRCALPAQRAGTIVAEAGTRNGLAFADSGAEQALRIRNTSTGARNISIRLLTSATAPAGSAPVAGMVPLTYWKADGTTNTGWIPVSAPLTYNALPAGKEWQIRFGARLPSGLSAGLLYQSLLEITDDAGMRWLVPVSAGDVSLAQSGELSKAGLWVGDAVLNSVSQPAHTTQPDALRTAGGEFSFRVLVHVDSNGAARLLRQAFLVRKPPVTQPDPEDPDESIVVEPARTAIITDEARIPQVVGSGPLVGRRLSSVAYSFVDPLLLSGPGFGAATLTATVNVGYDDPLNPFKHQFHPDHNNLDERFEQVLPEGRESFSIKRAIKLSFSATDPLGLNPPGWGETELGGFYGETITGLHGRPVEVGGTFRLVRVSSAPELNQ